MSMFLETLVSGYGRVSTAGYVTDTPTYFKQEKNIQGPTKLEVIHQRH